MALVYHIVPPADWEKVLHEGEAYQPDSLAKEGFIHFSTREQVIGTASRFYSSYSELVVLAVSEREMRPHLKYEAADDQMFPHYYAPLRLESIADTHMLMQLKAGQWEWV